MSWLRVDDHETLDSRVGELDNVLYRARHALMQLVAREYRDAGVFPPERIRHATYGTPAGPRALSPAGLKRLRELDFVRSQSEYNEDELDRLGIEGWPAGWLRIHRWERYNPPRDGTATERQRRRRHGDVSRRDNRDGDDEVTDTSRRDNRDSHGDVTGPRAETRARVPVPYLKSKAVKQARTTDTLPAAEDLPEKLTPEIRAALDELLGES